MATPTLASKLRLLMSASEAYYAKTPIMDDPTYDAHYDALVTMVEAGDASDPIVVEARGWLAQVGAPVGDSGWLKVTHKAPMQSLNKAQTADEFRNWHAGCGSKPGIVVSDKCDGISISLIYVDGHLTQAITRGDGDVGEDIFRNVVKMKGVVPLIKNFDGALRGEIVLLRSDWKTHFPTYSNPRNAAAGIAKREDGVGSEHLTVLHYQMLRSNGAPILWKSVEFQVLERLGAAAPNWKLVQTLADVEAIYAEYVASKRATLDYDIDGLVVEHDDVALMENLGSLNKRPRGAVAWKFGHEKKPTILRNIEWQVGKSGRITPVAIFDEVEVAGAKLTRASLAGVRQVQHLRLFEGCQILVSRRNDVIPRVEENLDLGIKNDI